MDELIQSITRGTERLLAEFPERKRGKIAIALLRLRENMARLRSRHNEYREIEWKIMAGAPTDFYGEPLRDMQLRLVDRVEAFHQQIYSTISVLILVLNYIRIAGIRNDHPIHSVQKFLEFLKRTDRFNEQFYAQIDVLRESVRFRAEFVDHPQSRPAYDWTTYRYQHEVCVIYFTRYGDEVHFLSGSPNPRSPNFVPPVDCRGEFFVSPSREQTYAAVETLIRELLCREI